MNILLTGATGFIGSAFLRLALARGHRVAALVRPESRAGERLPQHENLVLIPGTLAAAPAARLAEFAPQSGVHAAWIATPGVYLEAPENDDYVRWSLAFLEQARTAGARHFVVLGTCIEYDIHPGCHEPLREDVTPIAPQSRYARAKHALHCALADLAARADADFRFCWARVFYPYGPGEHPDRLCSTLLRKLRAGEEIVLKTPASTKDYIYIDDLAAALLLLVETPASGAVNLGTGEGVTVLALAETAAALCGRPELIKACAPPAAAADPLGYVVADATRLRALGWQPAWTLRAGLARLGEAPRERRDARA